MPYKLIMANGPYVGKTAIINGHKFVDGVLTLQGSAKDYEMLVRYFETFGAYPEGHPKLKGASDGSHNHQAGAGSKDGGTHSNQSSPAQEPAGTGHAGASASGQGSVSTGNGASSGSVATQQPTDEKVKKIEKALRNLNPDVPEHWTDAGLPRISTIAEATSLAEINRKDVENALPGWNRDVARTEAAKNI